MPPTKSQLTNPYTVTRLQGPFQNQTARGRPGKSKDVAAGQHPLAVSLCIHKTAGMPLSFLEYRTKLITKILFASSQNEVKRYMDTAMKSLERNKLNGHIITRFTYKMLNELESFCPLNKAAQQWSNIKMAKVYLNQVKSKLEKLPLP